MDKFDIPASTLLAQWTLDAPPSAWKFGLAGICAFLVVWELRASYRNYPIHRRYSAITASILRIISATALLLCVFEPAWLQQHDVDLRERMVILVDDSASMSVADENDAQERELRFERTRAAWNAARAGQNSLSARGVELDVRSFGTSLEPVDPSSLYDSSPRDQQSRLASSLRDLAEEQRRDASVTPISSVVVLTDGIVTRNASDELELQRAQSDLDVPVSIATMAGSVLRDISLRRLAVPEFAFVENVVHFEVEVESHGFSPFETQVELYRNGEKIATQPVELAQSPDQQRVRFRLAPDRTGHFVYEFRIPTRPGEATTENNRAAFIVRVLRDKVRVLHVAGRPDWDVRALRTLLKRDPNVELLSYYILRSEEDQLRDDASAPMSLIGFPQRELFEEQLGSFDLVILHNFDAYTHTNYMANMASYVQEGGSMVVIGGDMGLATGDYSFPPLGPLLPTRPKLEAMQRTPHEIQLTTPGEHHPVTSWMQGLGDAFWKQLPRLDSFNRSNENRQDELRSLVLLRARDTNDASTGQALLSVAEPGKGRILVLATGSSWRLGFAPQLPLVEGSRPYDHLWRNIIRWGLHEDQSERVQIELLKSHVELGEKVSARIQTVDRDYRPEARVDLSYDVRALDETAGSDAQSTLHGEVRSDELGQAGLDLGPLPRGAYELSIRRQSTREADSEPTRRVFLVGHGDIELTQLDPKATLPVLRRFTENSGGVLWTASEFVEQFKDAPRKPLDQLDLAQATSQQSIPIWNHPLMLLILLGLPLEWLLRRRAGLS